MSRQLRSKGDVLWVVVRDVGDVWGGGSPIRRTLSRRGGVLGPSPIPPPPFEFSTSTLYENFYYFLGTFGRDKGNGDARYAPGGPDSRVGASRDGSPGSRV